ncbi:MAG: thioredoxin domain-containing protein [Bacteroidota bacterium]|nr:thioredoxin domain-containing protein [Bacteroidota bacterium]MDP4214863.1 thioredoxin domain-containing protein [Bacteroidota bacterium]MDP4244725.1 thioredoxin domain-containing protein [Bacteroidota bacterium]MDP4257972.1 thioredoxin domain-containing protein [Bacteroidota bacterium]
MPNTNRLAKETSPYLLQHAHNPVDWYPWGEEALDKARAEDKPILVSIGYSACHWCHVMERESFENEETARFMNEHFVNIKIDREERPDLDHIYMEAVQAISGSGGWPLNVFLTPQGKPFYGGTYFPPRPVHNRSSWIEVLSALSRAYREKREEIEGQAESLTRHIAASNAFGSRKPGEPDPANGKGRAADGPFLPDTLRCIFENLMKTADKRLGGFGHAPKFPQTFSIRWLLHHYYFTGDEAALQQACLSLDKMILGGIYDQLGGGFARYSTDEEWLVPHFEKMLYDNALLLAVLADAYQLTGKELYKETIGHSMAFIRRELSSQTTGEEGAFYAALDADSEGREGKYYVWEKGEIDAILGEDSDLFCSFYGVSPGGNWEGLNILTRPGGATGLNALSDRDRHRLELARDRLLEHRSRRVRPALDDKILLGWNALMNIACSKAYAALGNEEYRELAILNMDFCWRRLKGKGLNYFCHGYKAGQGKYPAFLDDYAYLISALLHLQEITGDPGYLIKANEIMMYVLDHFSEASTGFFYFTHEAQNDLILRKVEVYDGAIPSGNATMAFNLAYMAVLFDKPEWGDRCKRMATALERMVTEYPGSFGVWATLYQALTYLIPEVVITGRTLEDIRKEFLRQMIPYRVFQSATQKNTQFPLLLDKPSGDTPLIFLCKNYSCQPPVNEVDKLVRLLRDVQNFSGKIVQ